MTRNPMTLVQLPDDVIEQGYKLTRPFHYEQVFTSPSLAFTGTEQDFVDAGHAYRYTQPNKHTRIAWNGTCNVNDIPDSDGYVVTRARLIALCRDIERQTIERCTATGGEV